MEQLADDLVIIAAGRVAASGTLASVIGAYPGLEAAFLELTAGKGRHPMTRPVIQPRLVSAEIMKIRTTRAWWIFLGIFTLLSAAALLTNIASHHYQLYPQQDLADRAQALAQAAAARAPAGAAAIAASMMTSGQFLTVLVAMLLGMHVVTSEIAQRTVTATFLVTPRREQVIVAEARRRGSVRGAVLADHHGPGRGCHAGLHGQPAHQRLADRPRRGPCGAAAAPRSCCGPLSGSASAR